MLAYDDDLDDLDDAGLSLAVDLVGRLGAAMDLSGYAPASPPVELDTLSWVRRYLPHYATAPASDLHRWLSDRIDEARRRRGTRIALVGPRGSAKSTYGATAYPLRAAVEGAESLIWLVSETAGQASAILDQVRIELENNATLAADYPNAVGRGSVWSATKLRLRNGVQIEAHSRGERIRGRRHGAARPTLIVVDDLDGDDAILSADARDATWRWLTGTLLKAGTTRTNVVSLANAIHREASGMRLTRTPGWVSRVFASIVAWPDAMGLWESWEEILHDPDAPNAVDAARSFYDAHRESMDAGAVVLWPEYEPLYALMMMRASEGRTAFEREKQSRPVSSESAEWPESYFDDLGFDDWPAVDGSIRVVAVDPSKGRSDRRSDYSAIVRLQVSDGTLYVDADLARRSPTAIVADAVTAYLDFRPHAIGIEGNAWQDLLCPIFADELRRRGSPPFEPWALENTAPKTVRIRRLSPWLAQRRIRFRRGSPGALLAIAQLRDFPDPHAHDDGPDAIEMALRLAEAIAAEPKP